MKIAECKWPGLRNKFRAALLVKHPNNEWTAEALEATERFHKGAHVTLKPAEIIAVTEEND